MVEKILVMMEDDLYYRMDRRRMGTAVIINNLDSEQPPTKNDVETMGAVLKDIGEQESTCQIKRKTMPPCRF